MNKISQVLLRTGLGSILFGSSLAFAQQPAAGDEPLRLEEFAVTGTRLTAAGAEGAMAVSTISRIQLDRAAPPVLSDYFRTKLPQLGGAGVLNETFGNGGSGQAFVSLRGLPGSATLVLVDGLRTSVGGDLNLIPQAAIERIEVLFDGAAAVYGSEAVAGVVNIILRKDFRGARLTVGYGNTTNTDISNKTVDFLVGTGTEKTNIVVAGSWGAANPQFSVDRERSRPAGDAVSGTSNPGLFVPTIPAALGAPAGTVAARWFVNPATTTGLTAAAQVPAGFQPLVMIVPSTAPVTFTAPAGWALFRATGTETPVAARTRVEATLNSGLPANANIRYGPNAVLGAGLNPGFPFGFYTYNYRPYERYGGYAYFDHKVSDWVTVFGQFTYMYQRSENVLAPSPLAGRALSRANFWVSSVFPALAPGSATVPAANFASFAFTYRPTELGPRRTINEWNDFNAYVGVRGRIADSSWVYQFGYQFNPTYFQQIQTGGVLASRYDAALAATTAAAALNPFGVSPVLGGPSPVNPQTLINSFAANAFSRDLDKLSGWEGNIKGDAFQLPGGPVQVSGGIGHRRYSGNFEPDLAIASSPVLIFPFNQSEPSSGVRRVWSYFGEATIPLVGKDFKLPLVENFDLGLAYRKEDYDDVATAPLGVVRASRSSEVPRFTIRWVPIKDELTIRASYAEGFIAPGLGEISLAAGQSFEELLNPIDGIRRQPTDAVVIVGNPRLQPTTAETYAVGVTWSPKFIKGFSAEVNYFKIEQNNIPFRSAQFAVNQWFDWLRANNSVPNPNNPANPYGLTATPSAVNPLGTQVEANADGSLRQVRNSGPVNTGVRTTDGIDFEINQVFNTDWGRFTFFAGGTWMFSFNQANFPGDPAVGYLDKFWPGGFPNDNTGFPRVRGNASLEWDWKDYGVTFSWNHSAGYQEDVDRAGNFRPRPVVTTAAGFPVGGWREIRDINTFDVQVRWTVPWTKTMVAVGANNVFDEAAPFAPTSFESNADRRLADLRGRWLYVRLTQDF